MTTALSWMTASRSAIFQSQLASQEVTVLGREYPWAPSPPRSMGARVLMPMPAAICCRAFGILGLGSAWNHWFHSCADGLLMMQLRCAVTGTVTSASPL